MKPAPLKRARCMKARRASRLTCGHHVLRGQPIINRGNGWICQPCALTTIRNRQQETAP